MGAMYVKQPNGTLLPIVGDAKGGGGGGEVLIYDDMVASGESGWFSIYLYDCAPPPEGYVYEKYVFEITQHGTNSSFSQPLYLRMNEDENYSYFWAWSLGDRFPGTNWIELCYPESVSHSFGVVTRGEFGLLGSVNSHMAFCNHVSTYVSEDSPRSDTYWGSYCNLQQVISGIETIQIIPDYGSFMTETYIKIWGILATAEVQ
ncbi:MAG: hypothetical protein LBC26_06660 [Oscillospiraceae bacterium]|jgi:hypothetical protein|nr:hypothetical protein [Oscillospiraceae bacterium]